jgi:hypothetical protein
MPIHYLNTESIFSLSNSLYIADRKRLRIITLSNAHWSDAIDENHTEEYDENGTGRTLTCIGFRPLPDSIAHLISKKYQLYR